MARQSASIEDLTAAALTGVNRALAARQLGPRNPAWPPYILVGFINIPDGIDWPWRPTAESGDEQPVPLTVRDHTIVMEAMIQRAVPLLKYLKATRERASSISPEEVLETLERIAASDETRDSIQRASHWLRAYGGSARRLDRSAQAKIKKVMSQVTEADSVDAKIRVLKSAQQGTADDDVFAVGLRTAAEMLEQGKTTIYNPDFYGDLLGAGRDGAAVAREAAGEIAEADVEGAIGGAIHGGIEGSLAGPEGAVGGAAIGAVAFGIGGSVGKGVIKLIDWLGSLFD